MARTVEKYPARFPDIYKDVAYKGYLIKTNQLANVINVSKNGAHITTVDTLEQAKKGIDAIVDLVGESA